jgi:hypothetical protein
MVGAGAYEGEKLRGAGADRGAEAGAVRSAGAGTVRGAGGAALRGAGAASRGAAGAAGRGAGGSTMRGAAAEGAEAAALGARTERDMLRGRTSGRGSALGALGVVPSERVVCSLLREAGESCRGVRDAVLVGRRRGCAAGPMPDRARDDV